MLVQVYTGIQWDLLKGLPLWVSYASQRPDMTFLCDFYLMLEVSAVWTLGSTRVEGRLLSCLSTLLCPLRAGLLLHAHWILLFHSYASDMTLWVMPGCSFWPAQAAVVAVTRAPTFLFRSSLDVKWKLLRWSLTTSDSPIRYRLSKPRIDLMGTFDDEWALSARSIHNHLWDFGDESAS